MAHPLISRAAALPALQSAIRGADLHRPAANLASRDIIGKLIKLIDDALAGSPAPADVARLEELRAGLWDAQMEEDAKSGAMTNKFDAMAQQAAAEDARGKSTPLPK